MRFSGKGWAVIAAMVIVAVISQVSLAQREEGRRGRGGPGGPGGGFGGPPSSALLLGLKEVQEALKLTDDQKSKLGTIRDELQDAFRKARQDGGSEKMQELMTSISSKVNEVLDEAQQKRLMGIMVQVNGANATLDPAVAKELNITDDQKKQLDEARQKNRDSMREAFEGAGDRDSSREETRAKFDKLREDANKKLLAVLTSEQQTKLESLKGEKVDIDMSALRGGPGGPGGERRAGRGGERGERGERGRRDRGSESKSEEKSSN